MKKGRSESNNREEVKDKVVKVSEAADKLLLEGNGKGLERGKSQER